MQLPVEMKLLVVGEEALLEPCQFRARSKRMEAVHHLLLLNLVTPCRCLQLPFLNKQYHLAHAAHLHRLSTTPTPQQVLRRLQTLP